LSKHVDGITTEKQKQHANLLLYYNSFFRDVRTIDSELAKNARNILSSTPDRFYKSRAQCRILYFRGASKSWGGNKVKEEHTRKGKKKDKVGII
jgi:hypothetical protein